MQVFFNSFLVTTNNRIFLHNLVNPGDNLIRRRSTDSSLTIPFERTFRDVDTNRPGDNTQEIEGFNFCGCGCVEISHKRNYDDQIYGYSLSVSFFYQNTTSGGHNTFLFQKE